MPKGPVTNVLNIPPGARSKSFRPLENNPEVISKLAHRLGLSDRLTFTDIYTIDEPDLLAFIPRPCYGLLLVFPVNDASEKFRIEEDEQVEEYTGHGDGEEVIWYKQTIGLACGLIALLHCLSSDDVRSFITPNSTLDRLICDAVPLEPIARANLLCDSEALEIANEASATEGDTAALPAGEALDLHFVCFVKSKRNSLWELDGHRKGPILRGSLGEDDDLLSTAALDLGIRPFLDRGKVIGGEDLRFNIIGLVPDQAAQ
ncbi:ubiquitin C-terminal hydrolase L3 [Talaromyces proteolyticus]|uniref:Ubiquitin carboxyl-terminal hydrolase n=1 Tax=Talaromyces proteolyticus TaxID=1131652 RepID=A0AAD4KYF7_9EURO|nr:ubiquitin C-terminal hydrolase L3 [Talaromyces proteolyticus]KAH8700361.1 ubiquitin C-terminal hydrolase L3 [Talaromyces proteolyticus]